jgi:aryl-alcohol dehydrogenase-like predicted oxidoreductase
MSERRPVYEQVTLWDWPIEGEAPVGEAAAGPASSAVGGVADPHLPVVQPLDPAVDEAMAVVSRSLAEMAATETRPLLGEPAARWRSRRIGDTDLAVFPVVLGASTFGWTASADAVPAILDAYTTAGGNAIDTADSYASGRSETLLGAWLASRRNRDALVLSTKISRSPENPGLSAQSILRSVDASLTRLGTDRIDLLYFSTDDRSVPLEESLTAADSLLRSGKVRHLAATGYSGDRLMEARITAGQLGLPRFVGIQAQYNLVHREEFEQRLFPVAKAQELAVLAHSPLASGFLSGKYRSRGSRVSDAHSRSSEIEQYANKRGFRVLGAIDEVAAQHGVAPATVALSWLLTKPYVTAPVVSASRPEQVRDLVAAAKVHLTRSQVASLDRASEHATHR